MSKKKNKQTELYKLTNTGNLKNETGCVSHSTQVHYKRISLLIGMHLMESDTKGVTSIGKIKVWTILVGRLIDPPSIKTNGFCIF